MQRRMLEANTQKFRGRQCRVSEHLHRLNRDITEARPAPVTPGSTRSSPKPSSPLATWCWRVRYLEPINRVIAEKVLAPTVQTLRYCCGTSKNDDYMNTQKDLKVALDLWYIVYASKGENMKIDDTNQVVTTPRLPLGYAMEVDFASAGATPSLTKTASANPV